MSVTRGDMMLKRLLKSNTFTAGAFFGFCAGAALTHTIDGGTILIVLALLAWSSIGILAGDWEIIGYKDHCQKQMDRP